MIDFLFFASTVQMINEMQFMVMEWMTAIVVYVNEFVQFIMPTMIYVITFKIVVFKS